MSNGRGADNPWIAAVANPDAYPLDESDIRRADAAMKLEGQVRDKVGHLNLCTEDGIDASVFRALTATVDGVSTSQDRTIDFVEVFAGSAIASTAVASRGLRAVAVEQNSGRKWDDLTSVVGVIFTALTILSLKVCGTAWFSPQCSTWVNCARGHTRRSRENPEGDAAREDVREANAIAIIMSEGR